ncbi:MAG: aldolase/citrate lyase family protein [Pseudomonadota bacterium]
MPNTTRPTPRQKAEALFGRLPARGCWLALPSPIASEIVGRAGFDFAIVDFEHGPVGIETAVTQMIALKAASTAAMARAPSLDAAWIKRLLDAGAEALMAPMIESADDAGAAVLAFRFGPEGRRGVATAMVRAAGYGSDPDYLKSWNDRGLLIAQLESPHAVDRADAIAAVDGVDALFFGPSDYAAAAAFPSDTVVIAALERVVKAAHAHGKLAGSVSFAGLDPAALEARGVDIVGAASDVGLLREAAAAAARR